MLLCLVSLSSHMRVLPTRRQILEIQQKGCTLMTYGVIAHTEEHHIIRFLSDDEYVMYDLFMPGLTDMNVRKYKDHNKAIQETYTLTVA